MASVDKSLHPSETVLGLMEHVHRQLVDLEMQIDDSSVQLSRTKRDLHNVRKGLNDTKSSCTTLAEYIFFIKGGMAARREILQELDQLIDRDADEDANVCLAVSLAKLELSAELKKKEVEKMRLADTIPRLDSETREISKSWTCVSEEELKELEEYKNKLEETKRKLDEDLALVEKREANHLKLREKKEQQTRINEKMLKAKTVRKKSILDELKNERNLNSLPRDTMHHPKEER